MPQDYNSGYHRKKFRKNCITSPTFFGLYGCALRGKGNHLPLLKLLL